MIADPFDIFRPKLATPHPCPPIKLGMLWERQPLTLPDLNLSVSDDVCSMAILRWITTQGVNIVFRDVSLDSLINAANEIMDMKRRDELDRLDAPVGC